MLSLNRLALKDFKRHTFFDRIQSKARKIVSLPSIDTSEYKIHVIALDEAFLRNNPELG